MNLNQDGGRTNLPVTAALLFGDRRSGVHVMTATGAATLFSQRVFDWLDETLAGVGNR